MKSTATIAFYARRDFLTAAAGLALLAGLLLPLPPRALDLFLAVSLCLTAALLLATGAARRMHELTALPALLAAATLLRMGLNLAALRMIFFENTGGTLLEAAGAAVAPIQPLWIAAACVLAAVAAIRAVCSAADHIRRQSFRYATEVLPLRRIGVQTDLDLGRIDRTRLREETVALQKESCVYINTAGVARLLTVDAVTAAALVIAATLGQAAVAWFGPDNSTSARSAPLVLPLAAAASAAALLPAMLIAAALRQLFRRTAGPDFQPPEPVPGQRITILSQESGQAELIELLNPDAARPAPPPAAFDTTEHVTHFEPTPEKVLPEATDVAPKTPWTTIEEYYDAIARLIDERKGGTILLTAPTRAELPVTVAVNAAIRLCRTGRVLLIDAEQDRNAVADVFDLNPKNTADRPVDTGIENLRAWLPDKQAPLTAHSLLAAIRTHAAPDQRVLIYAPTLQTLWGWGQLEQTADLTIAFRPGLTPEQKAAAHAPGDQNLIMPPAAEALSSR